MNDELGTRMKEFYENRSQSYLARRIPAIIRIDGKAFHTFTNKFTKPFDNVMIKSMQLTAKKLCAQIQGAKIAYTQSDEISLLLTDWDNLKTDAWFDYNIQKITSVSASMTTLYFNNIFAEICTVEQSDKIDTALFDARVFSIPKEDVNNYFWWRQIDCIRNSIQMLAQSNFSHKELQGKNQDELKSMLSEKNIEFDNMKIHLQRGSSVVKQLTEFGENRWTIDEEIPLFKDEKYYIERYL